MRDMEMYYLIRCLHVNFEDNDNFQKYCDFVTDCKKNNVSYEKLYDVVNCSFGNCIIADGVYECLAEAFRVRSYSLYNYLEKNVEENNETFYEYLSECFETELHRSLDIGLQQWSNTDFTVFNNIKNNKNIKNFCKYIDSNEKMNAFEVCKLYKSIYPTNWGRGNKYFLREMIIYDAALNFYRYSEEQRKSVKFFDYLLVEIVKHYIGVHHKYPDVTEKFKHQELLPCPFCGEKPKIRMHTAFFNTNLMIGIKCEDCSHVMKQYMVETNGLGQPAYLKIFSFSETIDTLIEKWNHRIKNDDMWLEDETLPDELPECEPDMFAKKIYAPGLKHCPFCGSKAAFRKYNSAKGRDGNRKPDGIKTISVVCDKGCFSASHFGTPESVPDKHTIGYMAYRWNQRKLLT